MADAGRLARRNGFLHLPEHGAQLRAADKIVAERALPMLLDGRFDPPWVRDIANDAHLPEAQVRQVLARLAQAGEVFQVVKDLYYHPQAVQELASLARGIGRRESTITAANFRDAAGLGRKRAIQILEFFDRIGFLRRVGDAHLLRTGTPLFPDGEPPS
jgi:selenocysteine-specific elongation factor